MGELWYPVLALLILIFAALVVATAWAAVSLSFDWLRGAVKRTLDKVVCFVSRHIVPR